MTHQLGFDIDSATRAKQEAITRADDSAHKEWRDAALEAVFLTAFDHSHFIVDEVWPYIGQGYETHELRAMGAVMRKAVKIGWIEPTENFILSSRVTSHRNPRRVWKSRVG